MDPIYPCLRAERPQSADRDLAVYFLLPTPP